MRSIRCKFYNKLSPMRIMQHQCACCCVDSGEPYLGGKSRSITAFNELLGATTLLLISSLVMGELPCLVSQLAIADAS